MSFILIVYIAFLLIIMFLKYKNIITVAAAISIIFGSTTGAFLYGLSLFGNSSTIEIFNSVLPMREYLFLMAGLYFADIIASIRVVRNYRDYKMVNAPVRN